MERLCSVPRDDWQTQFEQIGFSFHSAEGRYWDESACYRFSAREVDDIEAAAAEMHELCTEVIDHVMAHNLWDQLRIPRVYAPYVAASWEARDPSLYGRFDFAYDGCGPPKLLEYNADTPTSLVESAIAQWHWLQDLHPDADQFNSLHERLIARWAEVGQRLGGALWFSCLRADEEDRVNTDYLRDTAMQAGLETHFVAIDDIGLTADGVFVDLANRPMSALFKLYPWEWMRRDRFGLALMGSGLRLVEPPWKMLLSNKAILAILWERFPGHPNLLPTYFEPAELGDRYVRKPIFSREGADILLHDGGRELCSLSGGYGAEGHVYQAIAPLPEFDGRYPVVGAWIVGDEPAGMGLRDDATPITTNGSSFVPHFFS